MDKKGAGCPRPQQEFLEDAMARLGMDLAEFSARIGSSPARVERWLYPSDAPEFKEMDEPMWKLVRDIVVAKPGPPTPHR